MNGYLAVIGVLRADGPVGLLIGGSGVSTARVFPGDAPQTEVYPLVMVETFGVDAFDTKSGVSVVDHDLVKVFSYAESDKDAKNLAERSRDALDGYTGTINSLTIEQIRFLNADSYNVKLTNRNVRVHEYDYEVRVRV